MGALSVEPALLALRAGTQAKKELLADLGPERLLKEVRLKFQKFRSTADSVLQ